MLQVTDLHAWYGQAHVLQGIAIHAERGELVVLMGRNGAGKTTTLKSLIGIDVRARGGLFWDGRSMVDMRPDQRFHAGIAYVPEERRIIAGLTVRENLQLGLAASSGWREFDQRVQEVSELFPRLRERMKQEAVTMSGGEQQMLAVARALIGRPKLLLLDEPSEGVMPLLVDEMFAVFAQLRKQGMTILLVEQNVELALGVADRAYIMDQGRIVHEGTAAALLADPEISDRYCAV